MAAWIVDRLGGEYRNQALIRHHNNMLAAAPSGKEQIDQLVANHCLA